MGLECSLASKNYAGIVPILLSGSTLTQSFTSLKVKPHSPPNNRSLSLSVSLSLSLALFCLTFTLRNGYCGCLRSFDIRRRRDFHYFSSDDVHTFQSLLVLYGQGVPKPSTGTGGGNQYPLPLEILVDENAEDFDCYEAPCGH